MTLAEFMNNRKPGPFQTKPIYSPDGDFLQVYFEDEVAYAENVTSEVVVERAMSDNRIVGVKIFGVSELVRMAIEESHQWSSSVLKQCIQCGVFFGCGSALKPCDPSELADKTESCCECGANYPASDLIAGEIFCSKCRSNKTGL